MKIQDRTQPGTPFVVPLLVAVAAMLAGGRHAAAQPPEGLPAPGTEVAPEETPAPGTEDPTLTAGGALRLFMASRHYQTIRQLKSVMTERLQARFDHDSAPFNGKRGNRMAAFDFTEKDLKPPKTAGKSPAPPASYVASVRSLWEEQGETTEKRTEAIALVRQDSGTWRVADLSMSASEKVRFNESVNGVTVLRMVLRAWHHGDPAAARSNLSEAFLKKFKDDGLRTLFLPSGGRTHAAYEIVDMTPQGTTAATARVRLYEIVIGEPGSIEGQASTLKMVRKGPRWLLDGWD